MKNQLIVAVILLAGFEGNAVAQCKTVSPTNGYETQLLISGTTPTIEEALNNMRVLATAPGGEEWKEDHCDTSELYKVGDGSVEDPRAPRGNWVAVIGNIVIYAYGDPGGPYFWTLWRDSDGTEGTAGGLCWEGGGTVIATAPKPTAMPGGLDCSGT